MVGGVEIVVARLIIGGIRGTLIRVGIVREYYRHSSLARLY